MEPRGAESGGGSSDSATEPAGGGADGAAFDGGSAGDDAPPGIDGAPSEGGTPPLDTGVSGGDAAMAADVAPGADARSDAGPDTRFDAGPDAGSDDASAPDAAVDTGSGTCGICAAYGTPSLAGRIGASALNNVSGMAASQRNPGILYVHNDMTRTQFFALDQSAALLATFTFAGTPVVDLEDMAVGHCPSGNCVYLADIGGNTSSRTSYGILRLAEPAVNPGQPPVTTAVTVEKLTFSYPDGAIHNAESLLIDPRSDKIYVITKETSGPSTVYRLSPTFGGSATVAEKVVTLTIPKAADGPATAASAHPCGSGFLQRTNTVVYEFRIVPGAPFETAFAVAPGVVPLLVETQGEAITYRPDGRGYLTTGEGAAQPINQVGCR